MLIFLILVCLLIAGIILLCYDFELLGSILTVIGGFFLLICLITLPIKIYKTKAKIEQFKITEKTYLRSRVKIYNKHRIYIENAAIQIDIAKQNRWLVNVQYWNKTIFDIWIPDEIMNLEILE